MYSEFLLGPGFMPDTVLDAEESMMNKTSMVPALMKLTIRGGEETTHVMTVQKCKVQWVPGPGSGQERLL